MAVTLVGFIANNCDSTTGFTGGSGFGTDDAAWEGTAAYGTKASATTVEFYTTSLTSGPYNFSSGGGQAGYHIILWSNTKTPINATTGLTIIVGNGTSRGKWNVIGSGVYSGGWQSRVVNTARAFDTISAGSWTTGGNPGQLTNITQMGGGFTTTTSIMGSFNNVQIDQFTVGLGLRVDAGTVGTPNTFNTVKVADEDGTLWGWWSLSDGSYLGKGKLYIGPATGSATSVFNDSAFKVTFSDELVASDFYEIATRGAGTDVTWTLGSISTANTANRWGLTVDSTTNSFSDTNSVWNGGRVLTLNANSTLTGTTIIDTTSMVQNSATLDSITVIDANTSSGTAFLTCDDLSSLTDCEFEFSAGHAIELTSAHAASPSTHNLDGLKFTGSFGGTPGSNLSANSGSNDAMIYNNSGKALIINVINGGDTPSVRNGAGATTTVNNTVTLTVTVRNEQGVAVQGARVAIFDYTGQTQGSEITSGSTNSSGIYQDNSYSFGGDLDILVRVRLKGFLPFDTTGTITSGGFSLGVRFIKDNIVD
jgi:hypothetical protein